MILYSGPLSMFGAKAQIAVLEKGVACEQRMVPFTLRDRYKPYAPEIVRINPKLQVPVLIDGDLEIFDSTQILEYLEDICPEPALWPKDPKARAAARLLELKSDEIFFPHVITLIGLLGDASSEEGQAALAGLSDYYDDMEEQIGTSDYLARAFTYADIAFYMAQFFAAFLGGGMAPRHQKLLAWRQRMMARPAVAAVVAPICHFIADNGLAVPEVERALMESSAA